MHKLREVQGEKNKVKKRGRKWKRERKMKKKQGKKMEN